MFRISESLVQPPILSSSLATYFVHYPKEFDENVLQIMLKDDFIWTNAYLFRTIALTYYRRHWEWDFEKAKLFYKKMKTAWMYSDTDIDLWMKTYCNLKEM
jgi:hypothetical protein